MRELKKHIKHQVGVILILVGLMIIATPVLGPAVSAQSPVTTPSWAFTGRLNTARNGHTATLLKSGKVLVAGGIGGGFLSSAELYDPATGTWSNTGSLNKPRSFCTATPLPDGRVLVVGGFTNNNPPDFGITNTAELYDPSSGTWSLTGNLADDRAWHSATLLRSGKVLVAGGTGAANTIITNTAELWDPVTGTWTTTGRMATARYSQTATLLQDGNVLIAGGSDDDDFFTTLASVELYDPGAGTWTSIGSLGTPRILHAATLLPGGKVLASGGYTRDGGPPTSLVSAALYDSATKTWNDTGSLNGARNSHTATLLPGGRILVAGGYDWNRHVSLTSSELYDLLTGSWTIAADLNTARDNHSATLLLSGKVLVAGGRNNISGTLDSAELYDPGFDSVYNQIDDPYFFVHQHYRGFLNREPDAPGLAHWAGEITECNDPSLREPGESLALCLERKRANTSAAFFLSPEFQNTGSFVLRVYWGTLGKLPNAQCPSLPSGLSGQCRPLYSDYITNVSQVAQGIVVNDQLAPDVINANKRAFVDQFVNTPEFKTIYDSLNNQQFVDKLFETTGIDASASDRAALVGSLGTETRSSVVFKVVDGTRTVTDGALVFETQYGKAFYDKEFDDAFVFMEYIGYLRRNPDQDGFEHWLGKLKQYGNWVDAQMVLAFILSPEYRLRFAQ